jgi:hypothetical protein
MKILKNSKGVQTYLVELIDEGIQAGPVDANFNIFDKNNSPISSTTSFGELLRNYPDWTMYSKKDQGIQTSLIDSTTKNLSFISKSPDILVPSPIDSYGTNPETQGLRPFDSISQRSEILSRSNSGGESTGISINIDNPTVEISPIDSTIERSFKLPGGFTSNISTPSAPSTEPLKILKISRPISKKNLSSNLIQNFITMDLETVLSPSKEKNSILTPYLLCWYDGKRDQKHSYFISPNKGPLLKSNRLASALKQSACKEKNIEEVIKKMMEDICIRKYKGYKIYPLRG